ncbi:MAG TPA: hypothetical protein VLA37_03290, partial [Sphingomonadaceae bacterium]|nr:hypothetical protein [Sphingomonadaceae bacterium]
MGSRAFGQYFDNPDDLFGWLNSAVFGIAAMDAVNRSGVSAKLLEGPATAGDLAKDCGLPEDRLRR